MKRREQSGLALAAFSLAMATTACTINSTELEAGDQSNSSRKSNSTSIKIDGGGVQISAKDNLGAKGSVKIETDGIRINGSGTGSAASIDVRGDDNETSDNESGDKTENQGINLNITINGKRIRGHKINIDSNANVVEGSGHVVTETRTIPLFSKLENAGDAQVRLNIGSTRRLTVQADDNILPLIKTTVSDDTLRVWSEKPYSTNAEIAINITNPHLTNLELSGSGNCNVQNVHEDSIQVSIAGSANATVSGAARSLSSDISGSGNFSGEQLHVDDAQVQISGSGNAIVNADKNLDASVSGSGNIKYRGRPQVHSQVSGSGEISSI